MSEAQPDRGRDLLADERTRTRWPFAILAYVFAALAVLGLILPGLPTTPFVLLAAWSASRGSKRMHAWLNNHPRLGPPLADWREQRAVSARGKALALSLLVSSWALLLWRGAPGWILAFLAILFTAVAAFVGTRPKPRT